MSKEASQQLIDFFAETVYKNLIGLTRSEDAGMHFYSMKLERQNATEEEFYKFAYIVSTIYIKKNEQQTKLEKKPSTEQTKKMITDSFKEGWAQYERERKE